MESVWPGLKVDFNSKDTVVHITFAITIESEHVYCSKLLKA